MTGMKREGQMSSAANERSHFAGKQTASPNRSYQVSFAQQRLWFLDQLQPGNPAYNLFTAYHLQGTLNPHRVERCFNEIIRRHAILRTTFAAPHGQPMQIVAPELHLEIPMLDLQSLAPIERSREALRLAHEASQQRLHLHTGPLIGATLLQLDRKEYMLLLMMHHIVSDGWSIDVFFRELAVLYDAFSHGELSPLPPLSIQYADFAHWQHEWLQGDRLERLLSYWKKRLDGAPALLELPYDHPHPVVQGFGGAWQVAFLPREAANRLKVLSRQEGATLFMAFLAVFKVLLSRYSGQSDIVVGTSVAARDRTELEPLIGFFVNTLVLRTDLAGNPTFRELLRRVRETALGASEYQALPFERLVEHLQSERSLRYNPLFQVEFLYHNLPAESLERTGLSLNVVELESGTAKFDLTLLLEDVDQGLKATVGYDTALFEGPTISRMLTHLRTLIESFAANPDLPIMDAPLLSREERQQILLEWNASTQPFPLDHCFSTLFEQQMHKTPHKVAACFGEQHLTYDELNQRANQIAHHLVLHGIGPDTLVALLAERGLEFLVAIIAIFKVAGAYLPLDPLHPVQRLSHVVRQSGASLVLATDQFSAIVLNVLAQVPQEQRPAYLSIEKLARVEQPTTNQPLQAMSSNLAYVIYTSGSTGLPKGAMIEQRGMLNHLYAKIQALQLTENDRVAQTASQCFDISVWQFLAVLLVGGSVHVFSDKITHVAEELLRHVDQERISVLETVPSLLEVLLEEAELSGDRAPLFSALRWLIPTGESLPPELCRRWFRRYPHCALVNAYGPTECSDDVTHYVLSSPPSLDIASMPIGCPVANMRLYVLDQYFQPVPVGIRGELYVGGVGVGRGYCNDPLRTAERFLPDPFAPEPGSRLYRTGDIAYYTTDGILVFQGRVDHQVKIRGFRIELGEIEALLRQQPGIREAIVQVRGKQGDSGYIVAYLVAQQDEEIAIEALHGYLQDRLPTYMVPSAFVLLPMVPLTPNGKIDYKALPEPELRSQTEGTPLVNPVEEVIAGIWSSLLGRKQMHSDDNFFAIGGHSLLATQALARMNRIFQTELTLRSFFEHPTIAELSQMLLTYETKPGLVEKIALTMQKIERMSPTELKQALQKKRREQGTA